MKDYRVTWEIDILAESPEDAAQQAQQNQQLNRADYWCGVFEVRERVRHDDKDDTFENLIEVDLDEEGIST